MNTELFEKPKPTHSELVLIAANWLKKTCSVVLTEIATTGEEPDAIGWKCSFSTLVECKVSRSDFLADGKKWFRQNPSQGIGVHRYFLAPENVIGVDDLPPKWGLLVFDGKKVKCLREAEHFIDVNCRHEIGLLLSTVRRLGDANPKGTSIRFYSFERKKRATVGLSKENNFPTLGTAGGPDFPALEKTPSTGTAPVVQQ